LRISGIEGGRSLDDRGVGTQHVVRIPGEQHIDGVVEESGVDVDQVVGHLLEEDQGGVVLPKITSRTTRPPSVSIDAITCCEPGWQACAGVTRR
jgi:hypothetical protein